MVTLPSRGPALPERTVAGWRSRGRQVRLDVIGLEVGRRSSIPVTLTSGHVVDLLDPTALARTDGGGAIHAADASAAVEAFLEHRFDASGQVPRVVLITDNPDADGPMWARGLPQVQVISSAQAGERLLLRQDVPEARGDDQPALVVGATLNPEGEVVMDSLHRIGRSRGFFTARVDAESRISRWGAPQHATRMTYQDADGHDRALEFNPCDNILLAGAPGSGATVLSLPIMAHLVDAGYRVCRVDPKHPDEYPHVPGVEYTERGEGAAMEAIAAMEPGTSDRPAALVLDYARGLFVEARYSQGVPREAWLENLRRLMLDPHTAVIVRDEHPMESMAPWPGFYRLLGVRVLMGHAPIIQRQVVLGGDVRVDGVEVLGAGVMLSCVGADPQVIFPRKVSRR